MGVLTRILLLLSAFAIGSLNGERILFILPLATRSETHLFIPLAKELALKGHDITFVSPVNPDLKLKNFKSITPIPPVDLGSLDKSSNPLEGRKNVKENTLTWFLTFDLSFMYDGSRKVYENEEFKNILKESFDLIIMSGNFNDAFNGLVHKFKAQLIYLSSMPANGVMEDILGFSSPPSFVPNCILGLTDKMNFQERFINTFLKWTFSLMTGNMFAESEKIYREYLGQDYPSVMDIQRNVSLVFSNSHFAVTTPRPVMPDLIEIGGIHCREPGPLPKDLDDFLSGAKEGFIFFSLGSVTKGVSLPEETRNIIRNVFSRLKQRVLWKWESEEMPDLPANVKLGKWLPQQDILGHKNIKMFISHGGLLSTQEAAYHGVPVIGLPLFVDQDVNMRQAEGKGMSISLEILDLTEEILENAINKILKDPKYNHNAKLISSVFKNQPVHPLKKAVYWTEYVLKHKGAPHLRSPARDLTGFQYYSLDIIGTVFGIIFLLAIFIFICIVMIVKLLKLVFCRGSKKPLLAHGKNGVKKRQ